jgi:hypothetical protein
LRASTSMNSTRSGTQAPPTKPPARRFDSLG